MMSSELDLVRSADANYARWSFERLQLLQPQLHIAGLWTKDAQYYIICPDLNADSRTADGQPLQQWFDDECRVLGSPTLLTREAPSGAARVLERTIAERLDLIGLPHSTRDIAALVSLALPKEFPQFYLHAEPPNATLYVPRELTPFEQRIFRGALERHLYGMNLSIRTNGEWFSRPDNLHLHPLLRDRLDLVPARNLHSSTSASVRKLIEADEDFWMANRTRLLGVTRDKIQAPTINERTTRSNCVIDASVLPPRNIRTALALYQRIYIAMPVSERYEAALAGFQITEGEFVALAEQERVVFLLPQSIRRYPQSLVQRLADLKDDAMLLSRSLAAAVVQERNRRMPWLHAPIPTHLRRAMLSTLMSIQGPKHRAIAQLLARELGKIWTESDQSVTFGGARGLVDTGIGQIMAGMVDALTGRKLHIEMWTAAAAVEWAAALEATVVPHDSEQYSEQTLSEALASAYSGIENAPMPAKIGDVEVVVRGLLAISNDAPVEDVARAFDGGDFGRMRVLVEELARVDSDELDAAIGSFNEKVLRYERNESRLKRLDLVSLVGVVGTLVTARVQPTLSPFVPLGAWLGKFLLQNADVKRDFAGELAESVRSINSFTSRDVVMVSRLRKDIRE